MTELWYNNINVIMEDPIHIFPNSNLNHNQKINSIFRMAILLIIFILSLKVNQKYLVFPILLITVSIFLGNKEEFDDTYKNNCTSPTLENPFMNFILNDYYDNSNKPKNCKLDSNVKNNQVELFNRKVVPDPNDLWGQNISTRNFYTMPSTTIVNDQTGFAMSLLGESGTCKSFGQNCLKTNQSSTGTGMISYLR